MKKITGILREIVKRILFLGCCIQIVLGTIWMCLNLPCLQAFSVDWGIFATPLYEGLKKYGDFSIMVLPDHPTPLSIRTHCSDAVPYLIYRSNDEKESNVALFDEANAKATGIYIEKGHTLINRFFCC